MKIQPLKTLKALYYANRPLKTSKKPQNNIKIDGNLDGYFSQVIDKNYGKINEYAIRYGVNLNLSQKENKLLIDTGRKVKYSIDKNSILNENDIFNVIMSSIRGK